MVNKQPPVEIPEVKADPILDNSEMEARDKYKYRRCGAHYQEVEPERVRPGQDSYLNDLIRACQAITGGAYPFGGAVMTSDGFSYVMKGYACKYVGPFSSSTNCPTGTHPGILNDLAYGCFLDSSGSYDMVQEGRPCATGFGVKSWNDSGWLCDSLSDEFKDMVDTPDAVCGLPDTEILFMMTLTSMQFHCCGRQM